jgi:hypothetical protein
VSDQASHSRAFRAEVEKTGAECERPSASLRTNRIMRCTRIAGAEIAPAYFFEQKQSYRIL